MTKTPKVNELVKESEVIRRAYELAQKCHEGQKRKSGEPYFSHALATAEMIADWGLNNTTVAAALLHDVVEDADYPIEKIKSEFGEEITFLIEGLTKLGKIKYRGVELQVENLRKMILALSQDIRVIIIKLADRLHNMRTLSALPPQKQKRIALETADIYAPLAYRLGMQKVSGELEDLAFPFTHPKEYRWLTSNVKEKYEQREKYIEKVKVAVEETLKKLGIPVISIESRAKRYASLYKKLPRCNMDIDKIYDLVALRIIVPKVEDCYATLGIIHNMWPPLPGTIKDYIALPKPNGYRSLHTTVFCLDQKITEIQIRTEEMHNEAENGIAAYWAYAQTKGTKSYIERKASMASQKELAWVEQLKNWQKEFINPEEFIESLKIDFFKDRIFAISPKGEVVDLPSGATPVDFAYHIHSDIGDQCAGVKINGKIMPLNTELKSGDMVEVIIQKGKKPSEDWLEFVKSSHAKNHIKSALKGKEIRLAKTEPVVTELRIVVEDRIGLLKDITSLISRSHVNISAVNSIVNTKFPTIRIRCNLTNKDKLEKLIRKLRGLKEVKEITFQLY